jgi:hypothetical protein
MTSSLTQRVNTPALVGTDVTYYAYDLHAGTDPLLSFVVGIGSDRDRPGQPTCAHESMPSDGDDNITETDDWDTLLVLSVNILVYVNQIDGQTGDLSKSGLVR